ncbi:hypothetical protein FJ964_28010 [Mesorhizobium sp. B2-3-2]|nr:hypothetical protein FJ964_28010 [Mesorhizobium sp. B2-3-2]
MTGSAISPLVGEMPGRAEGGATERQPLRFRARTTLEFHDDLLDRPAGQRPPLSCRTSPPRGGRSAASGSAPKQARLK